jgi:hypothetical protein
VVSKIKYGHYVSVAPGKGSPHPSGGTYPVSRVDDTHVHVMVEDFEGGLSPHKVPHDKVTSHATDFHKAERQFRKMRNQQGASRRRTAGRTALSSESTDVETPLEKIVRLTDSGVVTLRNVSTEERDKLASSDKALPGGGYPIKNVSDLKNAIRASGRNASSARFAQIKTFIKKRARELGREDLIPENWS